MGWDCCSVGVCYSSGGCVGAEGVCWSWDQDSWNGAANVLVFMMS